MLFSCLWSRENEDVPAAPLSPCEKTLAWLGDRALSFYLALLVSRHGLTAHQAQRISDATLSNSSLGSSYRAATLRESAVGRAVSRDDAGWSSGSGCGSRCTGSMELRLRTILEETDSELMDAIHDEVERYRKY